MAIRTVSPQQQVENLKEALWTREYELEHRGIPSREIMSLVRAAINVYDMEQRVARGEVQPISYHECDRDCAPDGDVCSEWEDW